MSLQEKLNTMLMQFFYLFTFFWGGGGGPIMGDVEVVNTSTAV